MTSPWATDLGPPAFGVGSDVFLAAQAPSPVVVDAGALGSKTLQTETESTDATVLLRLRPCGAGCRE